MALCCNKAHVALVGHTQAWAATAALLQHSLPAAELAASAFAAVTTSLQLAPMYQPSEQVCLALLQPQLGLVPAMLAACQSAFDVREGRAPAPAGHSQARAAALCKAVCLKVLHALALLAGSGKAAGGAVAEAVAAADGGRCLLEGILMGEDDMLSTDAAEALRLVSV
jgi:hypothetical protein